MMTSSLATSRIFSLSLPLLFATTVALPAAAQDDAETVSSPEASPAPESSAPKTEASRPEGAHGPRAGSLGLSLGLPSGGAPTIGMSYGLTDRASLRMDLGLEISSTGSGGGAGGMGGTAQGNPNSDVLFGFSIDAGYRMYLWNSGSLHAFVQPGLFFSKRAQPGDFGALSTIAAVGTIGAEYFVVDQFSVSGATGLSLALSNDFQDVRLSTGTTALYANFYW